MKFGLIVFFTLLVSSFYEVLHFLEKEKNQVVVFGVDGLNNYRFEDANTPNFDALKASASWTMQALANEPLYSSPNWKSIISGATPEVHRVNKNGFDKNAYRKNPSCESEPESFPTIFTMIKRHDEKAKLGLFEHWGRFNRLVADADFDKRFWWEFRPKPNVKAAIKFYKKQDPALTFIHLDQCDHAGHLFGYESNRYVKALEKTDELLGMVLQAIEEKDGFENTTLLLVSDHGGKGKNHGPGTEEGMRVPWLIKGPGIKSGHEIKAEVKLEDTAVAILKALEINPHECWSAKEIEEIYVD